MTSATRWPTFSLLFFANAPADADLGKFDLFRASTRFADEHGFEAVWIPERHFHAFGGIFPNPALMAVVLAETTRRIRIRAGSVVLPLHHPVRVVEEWAVVDNLSGGRVDLAFAMGWNPNDFILAPAHYADRKRLTFEGIETVRRLWRGEAYEGPNGAGHSARVRVHPLPLQSDLAVWLTCSGGRKGSGRRARPASTSSRRCFSRRSMICDPSSWPTAKRASRPVTPVPAGSR
ncbi:MAG: LLM class flavin-dependent oxidoreductase [Verrucomicrobia bacterium]|nr:LLM class flavin-dependent oxidoreductase [Verrucomicrobiota bacterium]